MRNFKVFIGFLSIVFFGQCGSDSGVKETGSSYLDLPLEQRLEPQNSLAAFELHPELEVELFAAEPMVINPTNLDVDARGRVWVLESYNYGLEEDSQTEEGGRITILEDTDGDGMAEKRTVFYQGEDVHIALGIAVLGDKVYVSRSPHMLVFTDADGDDVPESKEIFLTGMGGPGDHSAHALVFGPDGKFYFNIGNAGGEVQNPAGETIIDAAGNPVKEYTDNYIGGIILRCDPDGSNFHVLGHNFRNNYEVAIDSYGNLWQSDNDDDGNRSCRINYILDYGNYGFRDEMTMAHWERNRTNIEASIPRRHWHQNDPGVVPNMLITGAGSPAGIMVYEGDALPAEFRGQMIHTDAGPNVVRAYPVTKSGAGYEAEIVNLLQSTHDQWFRPVDVAAAPDGSLMVVDWYDPGVGGGVAADHQRGRVYRISTKSGSYDLDPLDVITAEGAVEALRSPNMGRRYAGWTYLNQMGSEAESLLRAMLEDKDPVFRARAFWLLGKIPGKEEEYIEMAIGDADPNMRIVGVRLARQTDVDFVRICQSLINDPAPEVQREIAVGLHLISTREAAELWADLALRYDGDRWYLEALGIGCDNNREAAFEAWLNRVGEDWKSDAGRDIVWRSRAPRAMKFLADLISDPATDSLERLRYFRAFDFHTDDSKQSVLIDLLQVSHPDQAEIASLVLQHLDADKLQPSPQLDRAIDQTLATYAGTQDFVNVVRKFRRVDRKDDLLQVAATQGNSTLGTDAMRLLIQPEIFAGSDLVKKAIAQGQSRAIPLIQSLEKLGNKESLSLLSWVVLTPELELDVRREAVVSLGKSWFGEDSLLHCVKSPQFDSQLEPVAASVLFNVYRPAIQEEAAKYLDPPLSTGGSQLPPIRNLVASVGNIDRGKQVYSSYCATCHQVGGKGTAFGPELSEIGDKLSKEGLYRAIMFPSQGINYDYAGTLLTLNDQSQVLGIVRSENSSMVEVLQMGGVATEIDKARITQMEAQDQSLMPNLSTVMSEDEIVDLVEYLASLRKAGIQ